MNKEKIIIFLIIFLIVILAILEQVLPDIQVVNVIGIGILAILITLLVREALKEK